MSVNYTRINWEDSPSTQTPLNAENLNAMDSAIDDLAGAVNELDGVPGDIEELENEVGAIKNDLNQFPNGTYPNMSVGNADQLTATVGIEDNTPYLFRTSGGSVDIGDREDVRKIVGGTIVNNQLISTTSRRFENTSVEETQIMNFLFRLAGSPYTIFYNKHTLADTFGDFVFIAKATATGNAQMLHNGARTQMVFENNISVTSGHVYCGKLNFTSSDMTTVGGVIAEDIQLTDLTLDYGISIADYVLSLETATAGAGVAWLKKNFPAQFNAGYQAYDVGSLQSVSGLTMHKMVGFNQWNEEWVNGFYNFATGAFVPSADHICAKNKIRVLPNTFYYTSQRGGYIVFYDAEQTYISYASCDAGMGRQFKTPTNCEYLVFNCGSSYGTTYNHDICINLSWDGERDGEYEPYVEYTYPLDDSLTLRGIPKLDTNNQLYYDGDEYLPDGTINRRYGAVDMGDISWIYDTSVTPHFLAQSQYFPQKPKYHGGLKCVKFIGTTKTYNTLENLEMCVDNSAQVPVFRVRDDAYTSAADFKTAMSGVYLVYELDTPTTETANPYQETQIVDDFGTEEFVLADTAFPVPVGHETYYKNNLRAKLEMSPDSPDGDGLYVVQQTSGQNEYVPLASTSTIQDILTRLTALENA